MYWVLFRSTDTHETIWYETDDLQMATILLQSVVDTGGAELIDFSGDLDGALDHLLVGVKLFSEPETVKAA